MMKRFIPFMIATAVVAPLYLSTPAQAQSINDIQRLEERVNEAKSRGNWGAAQDLEVQLNMMRLQYQRNNGMGEINDRGRYQNNGYQYNPNNGYQYTNNGYQYNPGQNNGYYYQNNNRNNKRNNRDKWRQQQQQQRGHYDQNGRWHRD